MHAGVQEGIESQRTAHPQHLLEPKEGVDGRASQRQHQQDQGGPAGEGGDLADWIHEEQALGVLPGDPRQREQRAGVDQDLEPPCPEPVQA